MGDRVDVGRMRPRNSGRGRYCNLPVESRGAGAGEAGRSGLSLLCY